MIRKTTITVFAKPGATQAEVLCGLKAILRAVRDNWPEVREAICRPADDKPQDDPGSKADRL